MDRHEDLCHTAWSFRRLECAVLFQEFQQFYLVASKNHWLFSLNCSHHFLGCHAFYIWSKHSKVIWLLQKPLQQCNWPSLKVINLCFIFHAEGFFAPLNYCCKTSCDQKSQCQLCCIIQLNLKDTDITEQCFYFVSYISQMLKLLYWKTTMSMFWLLC